MRKIKLLIFLLITFAVANLFSGIKTKSYVDKKSVYIGDVIKYNIVLEYPSDLVLNPFDLYSVLVDTNGVQNFVIVKKDVKKSKPWFTKKIVDKFIFQLLGIQLGKQKISSLELNFVNRTTNEIKNIKLPEIEIEIKPVEKPKKAKFDGEIIDIKGPIWLRRWWWLIAAGILLCAVVGYLIVSYKKKANLPTEVPVEQQVDLKELTLKKLDALWAKDYISQKLIKEFYLELTMIVREYIGIKHKINALDLTTQELFSVMKKLVEKKYNVELKNFLDNADLSKFAKYIPEIPQIKQDFEKAKQLIE